MPRLKLENEIAIRKNLVNAFHLINEYQRAVEDNEVWLTEDGVTEALRGIGKLREQIDLLQDEIVQSEFMVKCKECSNEFRVECEVCAKKEEAEYQLRENIIRE